MTVSKPNKTSSVWMSGEYSHDNLKFEYATVRERISTLTETRINFVSQKQRLDFKEVVGKVLTLHVSLPDDEDQGRMFTGTCISVEAIESGEGTDALVAEVRPWFWMLTLTRNNRVFQDMTVQEIIEKVIGDHNQTQFLRYKAGGGKTKREYCVQYRESDFDFLSRLMEEEGLFYYFDSSEAFMKNEVLVICDSTLGLGDLGGYGTVDYWTRGGTTSTWRSAMTDWGESEAVVRGKVSLGDYDFEAPAENQMVTLEDKRGEHPHAKYEHYDLPGHYRRDQQLGKDLAEIRLAADSARHNEFRGNGTARYMGAGHTFDLTSHPYDPYNEDYLVIEALHHISDPYDFTGQRQKGVLPPLTEGQEGENEEDYSYKISAIKKEVPFRAPMVTPWPEVPGIQTGVVVGPDGEEIWTDKHGRIRVHFRWDRENPRDDTASCWIRVATGWSGNSWGQNSVPRVGQEVLIQFEDGDPDRPIVTGMLYNADKMPPYVDPSQPTRTGLMTRSSPDGGANDYNALVFEDKAGAEYTHFQSQKDYQMVVKDSAQITIGDDSVNVAPDGQDVEEGSLQQTVRNHVTELVQEGNKTETIESGTLDLTVEGDMSEVVRSGDLSVSVETGSQNVFAAQTITIEAGQKITLKVGGSSVVIDQSGVKIVGTGMAKMEAPMVTSQASGMLTLTGSLTKINS